MVLHDEEFFFAEPTNERGVREERKLARRIFDTFHGDGWQFPESFANALQFLGIRLSIFRKLNWLIELRG